MNLLLNLYKMTEMWSQVFCGIQGVLHTVAWNPHFNSRRTEKQLRIRLNMNILYVSLFGIYKINARFSRYSFFTS